MNQNDRRHVFELVDDKLRVVAEHYHHTERITDSLKHERNRAFLYLVAASTVGILLALRIPGVLTVIAGVAGAASDTTPSHSELEASELPTALLEMVAALLATYFTANLCHRTVSVYRNYDYMKRLEADIRRLAGLDSTFIAFQREGDFYWGSRTAVISRLKWVYVFIVFAMHICLWVSTILNTLLGDRYNFAVVIGLCIKFVAMLISFVFAFHYATESWRLDRNRPQVGRSV